MDQQLFNLARSRPCALIGASPAIRHGAESTEYGGYATTIFMIGWALGGFFFGILGDQIGRARTCC